MVIYFRCPEALAFLLEHGMVYAFLKNRRKDGPNELWWYTEAGDKRMLDVLITAMGNIDSISDWDNYIDQSGFKSVEAWVERSSGDWLYRIEKCE